MKKISILWLLVFCSLSIQAQKIITILHTNDTHSCILPLNENLADTMVAGRGGFLRSIAMLKEERQADPELLLFDSGDFSQGSPYYTLYKGDVEIGLMNEMGYAASTIGNHEFDFGLENMARIFKKANFPIICSNYDVTGTPLEGIIKPYIILKCKGVKIGIFALDPQLDGLVDKKNYGTVKYLDPVKKANEMAALLKKEKKCDLVICLSHLGWEEKGVDDRVMIAGSRDIDLVLGGHSHTFFKKLRYVKNADGKPVPVDQNGSKGVYIGKMLLSVKKK
ncbi:MAG: metallophosphatase [Prevotella sp.]|jgi:5'-nucleotidase|nr:metallophosphatase [Prevotella sp.]MCI1282648.1 metallophosphatase [Prevotella sp.]